MPVMMLRRPMHSFSSPLPIRLGTIFSRHAISANSSDVRNPTILPYTHGLDGVALALDQSIIKLLWLSMVALAILILIIRGYQLFSSHVRRIYSMSSNKKQQHYWSYDSSSLWPWFKREVLYAPLGKKRHNREIQLSAAINVGTVPSRFHSIVLAFYVVSNIAYTCILDYSNEDKAAVIAELRGRTGILAVANMVPLVLVAARNNPAVSLLKISFDTFNMFHRWIGRVVVIEAIIHTLAWGANSVQASGMRVTLQSFGTQPFLLVGLVATLAMVIILLQALSAIRHAFYEVFLHIHQALAFAVITGVYLHLEWAKLPSLPYIRIVIGIWGGERLFRLLRLLYLNLSRRRGSTTVLVEALAGEACRVTFNLPRHIIIRPGSHVYAYLPSVSLWMSHPFSAAWTNIESEPPTGRPSPISHPKISPSMLEKQFPDELPPRDPSKAPTAVSLIVIARTGMTRKLYNRALHSEQKAIRVSGYIEGPYAGHDSMASYGTVFMFAGGAGITHHLIQIRHLIAAATAGTVATRKIVLVWSVKDAAMLSWVRPWMDEILKMEGRRELLKILLFVTKPKRPDDLNSPSATVRLAPGRCNPGLILDDELPSRVGATAVSVCGPGAFADEVRAAVRERLHMGVIDLNEESFTW